MLMQLAQQAKGIDWTLVVIIGSLILGGCTVAFLAWLALEGRGPNK
jgi:hypothetical protein